MADLGIITDGAVLIDGDRIEEVGPTRRIENLAKARGARVIDATGKVVLPGLIDAHSRLLFDRLPPWGARFPDNVTPFGIADGTKSRGTRSARNLHAATRHWSYRIAASGTTTIDVRVSGDPESVRRKLRAAVALSGDPVRTRPVLVIPKFVPRTEVADAAAEPTERTLAWAASTETAYAVELQCGDQAVGVSEAAAIAGLAKQHGLHFKLILSEGAGPETLGQLVTSLNPLSVDIVTELEHASIQALSASDAIATLLPGVAHHSRAAYPQARALVDQGAAICLATAFGPEAAPSLSLPMMMSLACRRMRLTPAEAIAACTSNAAAAVGQTNEIGSIEPGKFADLALFDVTDYRAIPYYFGFNLCATTIRRGKIVYYAGAVPPLAPARSSST